MHISPYMKTSNENENEFTRHTTNSFRKAPEAAEKLRI